MLTAGKAMDVVAAFRDVGTYRGAAEICGVDPKTVKGKVQAHEAGELDEERRPLITPRIPCRQGFLWWALVGSNH